MKGQSVSLSCIAIAIGLSACHSTELTRSVEWFIEHRPELNDTLATCTRNVGELETTTNCINAKKAQRKITWGANGGGVKADPVTY